MFLATMRKIKRTKENARQDTIIRIIEVKREVRHPPKKSLEMSQGQYRWIE